MIDIEVRRIVRRHAVVGRHPRTGHHTTSARSVHRRRLDGPRDQRVLTRIAAIALDIGPMGPVLAAIVALRRRSIIDGEHREPIAGRRIRTRRTDRGRRGGGRVRGRGRGGGGIAAANRGGGAGIVGTRRTPITCRSRQQDHGEDHDRRGPSWSDPPTRPSCGPMPDRVIILHRHVHEPSHPAERDEGGPKAALTRTPNGPRARGWIRCRSTSRTRRDAGADGSHPPRSCACTPPRSRSDRR